MLSGPPLVEAATAAILESSCLKPEDQKSHLEAKLTALGYSWATPEEIAKAEGSTEQEDLALAFRGGIERLVIENNKCGTDSIKDLRVVSLMDLAVHAAIKSWVPRQVALTVMQEMLEAQTADQCALAFGYLEKRVDVIRQLTDNGEHKFSKPALLRCCNLLMQRLSKSSNLLLCGRVLMLLAHVLPLTEKSGVNLKGEFNRATAEIPYSTELEGEEAERLAAEGGDEASFKLKSTDEKLDGQMEVSFALYKAFWGLQKSLHNPAPLINGTESVDGLVQSVGMVLDHLSSYVLDAEADDLDAAADPEFHFPGFLTDTKLIALEFQDPVFRRQILVQMLVVMHYLLDRSAWMHTTSKTPELPRKARADLVILQDRAFKLLEATPPRARAAGFVGTIKRILQRENNWTAWKKAKCPDFNAREPEKKNEGDEDDGAIQVGDKRKEIRSQLKIYKRRFFNAEARDSFIPAGMSTGDILSICKPKEHRRLSTDTPEPEYNPTNLEDRLDIVRMEADAENDIDEEYRRNGCTCWRWVTLRMLASYDINLFEAATEDKKWLEGVVKEMDKKKTSGDMAGNGMEEEDKKGGKASEGDSKVKKEDAAAAT